jgi:hypothetical protein
LCPSSFMAAILPFPRAWSMQPFDYNNVPCVFLQIRTPSVLHFTIYSRPQRIVLCHLHNKCILCLECCFFAFWGLGPMHGSLPFVRGLYPRHFCKNIGLSWLHYRLCIADCSWQ